ncbi:uncharacterized protein [Antedon mediterranea]|uniref:uncharacterized protein n=1 Tax=Antedon mediterranea TaxID=105859 RepID=UPI003AF90CB4
MAERRRIIPLSVGPLIKQEEAKPEKPTPRFTLSLAESNERECPEFCFSELMKNALGHEDESDKKFNELEEDDLTGMAALAKKFEQKYGPQKAKKKRQQIEDIIDVGLGYDENDPFVDNSECYDELVPSMLDTQLGGFYINSGQLNFKEIDASSTDSDFQVHRKRKKNKNGKKKRSNSSESHHKREKKKHKVSSLTDKPKKRGRKHSGHEKKRKKEKSNPTIAELLQRKAQENVGGEGTDKKPKMMSNPPVKNGNIMPSLEDLMGSFNLPLDSEMEQAMRDVMVDCETLGTNSDIEMNISANEGDANTGYTKCPDGLQEPLKVNIMKIKEAARKSEEGKCKFFTNEVNNLLLDIETQTRELSCGTRSSVYSHLSHHLPCGKETLLKRAKKLRLGEQDSKLKEPLQKLKEAVGRAMPSQLERYQQECQAAAQAKYNKMMDGKDKPEEAKSEDDDDGGDKNKKSLAPRKKFVWTDHLRTLLCELVLLKVKAYGMLKSRSQSAEDYLKAFLEAEVKAFWPNGWIQTRTLFKESRSVHQHLTSTNPVKPKKPLPLPKKVQLTNKKPASPVLAEMSASISAPSNSVSAGASYASSILKEMANTKGTNNAQKDVPTLLDYANENNSLNKYPVYSSKTTGNAIAASPLIKTTGTVLKTSPESGSHGNQQNVIKPVQTKDSSSHQSYNINLSKTVNKNFNDSFINNLIARTLKEKTDAKTVASKDTPAGFSDLKLPDMSAAFELLAGAARQQTSGSSGFNQVKISNKDKHMHKTTTPVKAAIDKNNVQASVQLTTNKILAAQQSGLPKGYGKSLGIPHNAGTSQKPTAAQSNSTAPKWSGNSYLKIVDKTKPLTTQQFTDNSQRKNMFHAIQEGKSTSKNKETLVTGIPPSNDVSTTSGVINNTNKRFLSPQHVSPKRTGQASYMQSPRSNNVVPQRTSPSTPKQQVKPPKRTSPAPYSNQSPVGSPSINHSPMSPIASPSSPSIMPSRSLFHPTSPQRQQAAAAASMNLLYGNNYSMQQQLTGFQMQFADMAMKHSGNFAVPVGQGSPGHGLPPQTSSNQTSPEAVITGPAPGTYFYTQQGGASAVFNNMHGNAQQHLPHDITPYHQTFTDPRFTQDNSGQMQHRIP